MESSTRTKTTPALPAPVVPELTDPFGDSNPALRLALRRSLAGIKEWLVGRLNPSAYYALKRQMRSLKRRQPPGGGASGQLAPSFVLGFDKGSDQPLTKKALMLHISGGFWQTSEQLRQAHHINYAQAVETAYAFNQLGYKVDVLDVFDFDSVPPGDYDVIFGEHYSYGRLLPSLPKKTVKIFYGTRSYWKAEHQALQDRARRINQTRGAIIPFKYWEKKNDWVQQSDAVIVLGNRVTSDTYAAHHPRRYTLDNSALPLPPPQLGQKDFESARTNFLWLGSGTLLRKGLDLVLEAFAEMPELHLWVCGPLEHDDEKDFVWAYRRELFHTPNIHPIGFVQLQSETLKRLTEKCASLVFMSSSEGMSGGVLDSMSRGLIPIVSAATGVDTEEFGITVEPCTVEGICTAVRKVAALPPETCRKMAEEAHRRTQTRYALLTYRDNIRHLLHKIIEQTSPSDG